MPPPPNNSRDYRARIPFLTLILLPAFGTPILAKPIVLNSTKAVFPHVLPGKILTLQKVFDPVTREGGLVSTDGRIRSGEDLVRLEQANRNQFRAKYGRLSESLVDSLQRSAPGDRIRVIVTLRPPAGITYLDKTGNHTQEELKQNSLSAAGAKPRQSPGAVLANYDVDEKIEVSEFSAVVSAKPQVMFALAKNEDVASVTEYTQAEVSGSTRHMLPWLSSSLLSQITGSDPYYTLSRSAYSHSQAAIPSLGNSVRGATFESGLTSAFLSCAGISPTLWDPQPVPYFPPPGLGDTTSRQETQYHSLATFQLMALGSPGSRYYHRRSVSYRFTPDQNFIINNSINSISMSIIPGFPGDMQVMDDFAYRYPYPTFVTPTGNGGYMYPSEWSRSYNQINVGNVQDSAFQHFTIPINWCSNGLTQTRNPGTGHSITSGCIDGGLPPNCASDREMPYIVAPGWAPNVYFRRNPDNSCTWMGSNLNDACSNYAIDGGTSAAAPTANAMVLNLLGQASFLVNWPEGTRAILLLTSRNVTDGYWNDNFDGKDGNGIIHGQDAIAFAQTKTSVSPGNTAVENGLWMGSLTQSDFNYQEKAFNIRIPSQLPSGKHLRVVLTWDASPDLSAGITELSDIDLLHPASGTNSNSWNSNIEILDLPQSATPAGSTQTVSVFPYSWRHSAGARSSSIYVALAWTFVSDHAR